MMEKKRRSLNYFFAIAFAFAMVMVFAGLVGQKDVYAESNPKEITVTVTAPDGSPIKDATVYAYIWKPTGKMFDGGPSGTSTYYTYDLIGNCSVEENENGVYRLEIECDPTAYKNYGTPEYTWSTDGLGSYKFTVGASAEGFVSYATISSEEEEGITDWDITKCDSTSTKYGNQYHAIIGSSMYDLSGASGWGAQTSFEISMEEYNEENILAKRKEKAITQLENYKDLTKYYPDQQTELSGIITTAKSAIQNAKSEFGEGGIKSILSQAMLGMDAIPTIQTIVNNKYKGSLCFEKDGRVVPFDGEGENLSITLTLTNYDKNGQFTVKGLGEGAKVNWYALRQYSSPSAHTVEFIGSGSGTQPGVFLGDKGKPSYASYYPGTLSDCYVEFPDPETGETQHVTFTLNIVSVTINSVEVKTPEQVELQRDDNYGYTTTIAAGETQDAEHYTVNVNYSASTAVTNYEAKAAIKSLTPTIAKVENGVIIPLKSGKAIFEAISDDNTYIKERFYINFTLSSEEEDELIAAQEVDELIDAIGTVTLASKDKIVAARAAYNALGDDFGRGVHDAQSKVKKLSVLEAAESRLQELIDIKAAADVDEKINDIGTVSLDSVSKINLAEGEYAKLNENARKLVKGHETLIEARERLTILQVYETNGETIADLIAAIDENAPETDEWADAILDAKEAYDSIETEEERKFIDTNFGEAIDNLSAAVEALGDWNEDKLATADAAKVEKMIKNLGEISLAKESDVQAARAAYEKLSANAKTKISAATMAVLTSAEGKVTALKEAEAKKAQEAANAAPAPTVQLDKITLKVKAGKAKATLTWKKSSKADGYIIYRATKKNGKYKQIKVIKSWKKTSFTDKKVKSKKTYYYKICSYKGTVNGPVSAAKKAKVK